MNGDALTAALLDDEARTVSIALRDLFTAHRPAQNFKPKRCARCGASFTPTSAPAKFCPECQPEATRERVRGAVKAWREANPERSRELRRRERIKKRAAKADQPHVVS